MVKYFIVCPIAPLIFCESWFGLKICEGPLIKGAFPTHECKTPIPTGRYFTMHLAVN